MNLDVNHFDQTDIPAIRLWMAYRTLSNMDEFNAGKQCRKPECHGETADDVHELTEVPFEETKADCLNVVPSEPTAYPSNVGRKTPKRRLRPSKRPKVAEKVDEDHLPVASAIITEDPASKRTRLEREAKMDKLLEEKNQSNTGEDNCKQKLLQEIYVRLKAEGSIRDRDKIDEEQFEAEMEREKDQRKEEIKEEKRRMALELERNKSYSVELKRILPCIKNTVMDISSGKMKSWRNKLFKSKMKSKGTIRQDDILSLSASPGPLTDEEYDELSELVANWTGCKARFKTRQLHETLRYMDYVLMPEAIITLIQEKDGVPRDEADTTYQNIVPCDMCFVDENPLEFLRTLVANS